MLDSLEVWVVLILLINLPFSVVSGQRSNGSSYVAFVLEALIEPLT